MIENAFDPKAVTEANKKLKNKGLPLLGSTIE